MIAQWELEVKGLVERAAQAEARENKEPLDIPAALARREKRVAALKQARAVMARNGRVNWRRRSSPNTKPNKPRGQRRAPPSEDPAPSAQYNFTAPESGLMKAGHGQPFAQAAVDGAMPIVGERVSVAANDQQELAANSPVVVEAVPAVLAASGVYSEAAVQAVEAKPEGTLSGITVYAAVEKQSHHKTVAEWPPRPEPAPSGPEAGAKEHRAHRLKTAVGKSLYKRRKQTVAPGFGIIKEVLGFRRFVRRGADRKSASASAGACQ